MKTIRPKFRITRARASGAGILLPALVVLVLTLPIQPYNLGAEPVTDILGRASSLLGTPYRSGGIQPGGFDCSGFVSYLIRPAVPGLPRISRDMARTGNSVGYGEWKPGDLLFYATGTDPSQINHVAIWYGNGAVIHSISDGPETGVVLTPAEARYWKQRYVSARRVLPDQGTAIPETPGPTDPSPADIPKPPAVEESPWNDFEGYLRGDFDAWRQADQDAFEAYRKQNG
ncbi:MAG: C40 family peptidase [Spirochaetaceae bacterium]|nr:C40 family peptidase [Spirochaetaceae bacterium]MDT8299405.1 C40 family peptidase [Spirochaetaceae bacterium]